MNKKTIIFLLLPISAALTAGAVLARQAAATGPEVITGTVETTEIDLGSKVPGRVAEVRVHEGDPVKRGEVLAVIASPELEAKVAQAKSVVETAQAKARLVTKGARSEEREAALRLYLQAKHGADLAQKTFVRVESMFKAGVLSEQERDQAFTQAEAAREQMDAAKAKADMAEHGARADEILAAQAALRQAEGALAEVESYQRELNLVSPLDAVVRERIVDPGELVATGYPVLTLLDLNDAWVVLQLREDRLAGIKQGDALTGVVPALGNKAVHFTVSQIAAMADFATWRPTHQKGEFDLRTFEVHLRPDAPVPGLLGGMTVNVELAARAE